MAVPPPLHDPTHIETRLLIVAEMLEKAVAEVRRAVAVVRNDPIDPIDMTSDRPAADNKPDPGVTDG